MPLEIGKPAQSGSHSCGPLSTDTVETTTDEVDRPCCCEHHFSHRCLTDSVAAIFAKRLKVARALRGLSQRALGGIVSGDKASGSARINRYEQMVNRADMDTAAALAQTLDVPLAYLFAEEDDQADLLLAFAKLSKAERTKLLSLAQQMASERQKK